jgi:hypothetical protein
MPGLAETTDHAVNLQRLYWVGPATVVAATLGVAGAQRIAIPLVGPLPAALRFPMVSAEPLVFTAVLVTAAIIVFIVIVDNASHPVRVFRRVAGVALCVSFLPNMGAAWSLGGNAWKPALALAVLHVVAWAITVTMLTKLTAVRDGGST